MGLDEESWEEFMEPETSPAASARNLRGETPHLGMGYLKMLIDAGEAVEGLVMLQRLLGLAERRNPLHAYVAQLADASAEGEGALDAEFAAILHSAPPKDAGSAGTSPALASGLLAVDREAAEAAASAACVSRYREWCAKRVAVGELSIIRSALAVLAELIQSAEEASEAAGSQSSDESSSGESEESLSPDGKRQRV